MSVLKDVIDIVKDVKDSDAKSILSMKQKNRSISRLASDGILQFPLLVSRNISIDNAMVISKALESEFSSFITVAMNLDNITTDKDVNQYIKKFHQNIKNDGDIISADDLSGFIKESLKETLGMDLNKGIKIISESSSIINDDSKINYINNFFVSENIKLLNLHESSINMEILNEKSDNNNKPTPKDYIYNIDKQDNSKTTNIDTQDNSKTNYVNNIVTKNVFEEKNVKDQTSFDIGKKVLLDMDVKKTNDMQPTMLHLILFVKGEDGIMIKKDFIIGIKTVVHPVDSGEMIKNIINGVKRDNNFFNFIRSTTGEINFIKDFLFAVDAMKDDAVSTKSKTSRWWGILKRRKLVGRIKALLRGEGLLPNSSIVMTLEEAMKIKNDFGIDLLNGMTVKNLMSHYFLLAFVVFDMSAEIVQVFYDGELTPQTYTISNLEKIVKSSGGDKPMALIASIPQR